jgi:hypothetical protein
LASLDDKNALVDFFRAEIADGAVAFAFIAESWMLPPQHTETRKFYNSIAENPNREEILLAQYSCPEQELMAIAKITYKETDPWSPNFTEIEKPNLGDWEIQEDAQIKGRYANLWPER